MADSRTSFVSTNGGASPVSFLSAVDAGLAPDGGLYVPADWTAAQRALADLSPAPLPALAARVVGAFVDAQTFDVASACDASLDLPTPLVPPAGDVPYWTLELFHGPTAAFKDYGARFLAACLSRTGNEDGRPLHVLVATSGDTGGAVAAAFDGRPGARVTLLYPSGLVSPLQERQLTCWGDTVTALSVDGTFDDCQRLVKAAFAEPSWRERFRLSSANSINVGRLLPQVAYYAHASLHIRAATGRNASFIVPSGNLGNAVACCWARTLGCPVDRIVLAHNRNRTVVDFLESGFWQPRPSVSTPASAMDVGDPSNMARLRHLYPSLAEMRDAVRAESVDDDEIRRRIAEDYHRHGRIWCPHSAAAAEVFERRPASARADGPWVVVATADPAKFPEVIEPIIKTTVPLAPALAWLDRCQPRIRRVTADMPALLRAIAPAC